MGGWLDGEWVGGWLEEVVVLAMVVLVLALAGVEGGVAALLHGDDSSRSVT
jgi:hypothetical protein